MILKSELQSAYEKQQQYRVESKPTYVRRLYLEHMQQKGKQVEVISGIRRCGKSTLMKLLIQDQQKSVAYFNFEDPLVYGFDVKDFQKLDQVMGEKNQVYYFDEIQNVPSWELFVRQLHDRGKKVYITGSNASLLSKELGTRLTGRYLQHELFPFSYEEFLKFRKQKDNNRNLENYLKTGGFPEYLKEENPEVLQLLLRDIVMRDIAIRYGIRNTSSLMELSLYLLSNVGKPVSFNNLKKVFGIGSANTVSDYAGWLNDSYLLFFLPKFSWSAKSTAVNARKVYAIDNGLIQVNTLSFSSDTGRMLENLVFLHLRQSGGDLYYFRENKECDFVVMNKKKPTALIQVCAEVHADNLDRELSGLTEAMQFFKFKKGMIVTLDQQDTLETKQGRIEMIPLREFLKSGTHQV